MTNNQDYTYLLRINKLYENYPIARKYALSHWSGDTVSILMNGQEVQRVQPIRDVQYTMHAMQRHMNEAMIPFIRTPNTEATRSALLNAVNAQLEQIGPVGIDYTTEVTEERDGVYTVQVSYPHPAEQLRGNFNEQR